MDQPPHPTGGVGSPGPGHTDEARAITRAPAGTSRLLKREPRQKTATALENTLLRGHDPDATRDAISETSQGPDSTSPHIRP
ncbi:hypothetical protein NDU88_008041 [Pleurodeles waltl]|uniref:Uncharacterized protein n=1 Tax=Pleurodeles waltl TaxID=8319 RepID=A0AAV7RTH6_PLEWA|nr:hypothetical protein NDU88_008041 [Pleurodeles waltl]